MNRMLLVALTAVAPLNGTVHLSARPGDLVKADQVLATIHPHAGDTDADTGAGAGTNTDTDAFNGEGA